MQLLYGVPCILCLSAAISPSIQGEPVLGGNGVGVSQYEERGWGSCKLVWGEGVRWW